MRLTHTDTLAFLHPPQRFFQRHHQAFTMRRNINRLLLCGLTAEGRRTYACRDDQTEPAFHEPTDRTSAFGYKRTSMTVSTRGLDLHQLNPT